MRGGTSGGKPTLGAATPPALAAVGLVVRRRFNSAARRMVRPSCADLSLVSSSADCCCTAQLSASKKSEAASNAEEFPPAPPLRLTDWVTSVGVARMVSAVRANSLSAPTNATLSNAAAIGDTMLPAESGSLRMNSSTYGSSVYACAGEVVKARGRRVYPPRPAGVSAISYVPSSGTFGTRLVLLPADVGGAGALATTSPPPVAFWGSPGWPFGASFASSVRALEPSAAAVVARLPLAASRKAACGICGLTPHPSARAFLSGRAYSVCSLVSGLAFSVCAPLDSGL